MTYIRTLCLVALGTFVFVGCDSNDDDDNRIDRVRITSVEINEFPEEKPNGDNWDGGLADPDPDVYFILFDDNTDNELDSTNGDEFSNVDNDDAPLIWDGNYVSRDFDRPLYIGLFDEDPTSADDEMGYTNVFRLNDRFDRPTMTVTGPNISILLRLEWD